MTDALLEVSGLRVSFPTPDGPVQAVDGVDLRLAPREVLAIVGESGSGKSVTALTLLGLTTPHASYEGAVTYRGIDLLSASKSQLRDIRGRRVAMIFQDALTSLNPVARVGDQIAEMIVLHNEVSGADARQRAVGLLTEVGIADASQRARAYPHELSGGMRQRALIAMAVACNPDILIADEPTTALDVTIQAQVLALLKRLKDEHDMAVILISHDLGLVAEIADRIAVMYAGRIVEQGTREQLLRDPQHPYTWGLLGSVPRVDRPRARRLTPIAGQPPSAGSVPSGCAFRPRCPMAFDRCVHPPPLTARSGNDHLDACWLAPEDKRRSRAGMVAQNGGAP
jgi:peptide/nickel transport system ATP-binding protein/oligopeptide transport system ATP-binding protein